MIATLLGIAVSLAALGWLTVTDPKRRRAFRRPVVERRGVGLAWAVTLAPAALVPIWGGAGGFFVWFGAISVAGWAVAAISPDRADRLRATAAALSGDATERLATLVAPLAGLVAAASAGLRRGLARAAGPARAAAAAAAAPVAVAVPAAGLAELERRVRELEAEVARLRGVGSRPEAEGTVIELAPRPAARL